MTEDFHDHLDTARLWWGLADAVLDAIAEGPSTARSPYGSMAGYVLGLKRASTAPEGVEDTAALMKIALRLANTPEIVAERRVPIARRPVRRALAIAAIVTLVLAALLTAAATADVIDMPEPVRDALRRIGVDTEAAGPRRGQEMPEGTAHHHHDHGHFHPMAFEQTTAPDPSERSEDDREAAPSPVPGSVAPAPTPPTDAAGDADDPEPAVEPDPKPDPTPAPTDDANDRKQKDRDKKRDEDQRWSRTADEDE